MTDPPSDWESRLDDERVATDADQTEIKAIRLESINIDEGLRDEDLGASIATHEEREERAGAIADEVKRRRALLGDAYPFEQNGNSLTHKPSKTSVYEFCLSISFVESLSDRQGRRFQIAFERLTRDVMRCFLGAGTEGYRTGVPGDSLENRPRRIKAVVKKIHELTGCTGEWTWNPEMEFPDDPLPRDVGDLGMDVVLWKLMPDKRRGGFFSIGQCACGLIDWKTKFHEPDFGRLRSWIRPLTDVPPLKFFSVPFHIPNAAYFGEVSRQAGLTLDRTRIALIAENPRHTDFILSEAKEKYSDLAEIVVSGSRADVRGRRRRPRKAEEERRSR